MLIGLLPYALLALGLLGSLALFFDLKREMACQRRKHGQQIADLTEELKQMKRSAGPRPGGMTAGKREQAIQLFRQGADAAGIARTLELPRQEIELLLRIHKN